MKKAYKIPFTINVKRWEAPVSLTSKDGSFGLKKQVKLITLFIGAVLAIVLPMYIFFQSPLSGGGWLGSIMLFVGWELFVALLLWPQDTGEDGWKWIVPTLNYWINYADRKIETRGTSALTPVQDTIQIKGIDPETGVIETENGWFGFIYKVDGHASNMLFESEMADVIGAFEKYLMQMPPNAAISIITQFMPLDLTEQTLSAERRTLAQSRVDLRHLAGYRERLLRDSVAKAFPTVTQWVFVSTSDSYSLLEQAQWFEQQIMSGMAKEATRMTAQNAELLLASLYRP